MTRMMMTAAAAAAAKPVGIMQGGSGAAMCCDGHICDMLFEGKDSFKFFFFLKGSAIFT